MSQNAGVNLGRPEKIIVQSLKYKIISVKLQIDYDITLRTF